MVKLRMLVDRFEEPASRIPSARHSLFELIASDVRANRRNWKGLLLAVLYRLAHACATAPRPLRPFLFIYVAFYKFVTEAIIGTEIHWRSTIGPSLTIYHGYGTVVHSNSVIGARAILRHGVTIGIAKTVGVEGAPVIGDDVDIGASAIILGAVTVGSGAVIGAGTVVIRDVPPGAVVVGNPGRIVRQQHTLGPERP